MNQLFTQEQFNTALSNDQLPLKCKGCERVFHLKKRNIQDCLNPKQKGRTGEFCSRACFNKHFIKSINLNCRQCNKPITRRPSEIRKVENVFCSSSCSATFYNKARKKPIQNKPVLLPKVAKSPVACLKCGNLTLNRKYCSGSCRNQANNKLIKGHRSKAEYMLSTAISKHFPSLKFETNNRTILNGLELDFYFPSLKLAIEWNGIFHYAPIRGDSALAKIQSKDAQKIHLCKEAHIDLIIICDRTSHLSFIQETINDIIDKITILLQMAGATGIAPV